MIPFRIHFIWCGAKKEKTKSQTHAHNLHTFLIKWLGAGFVHVQSIRYLVEIIKSMLLSIPFFDGILYHFIFTCFSHLFTLYAFTNRQSSHSTIIPIIQPTHLYSFSIHNTHINIIHRQTDLSFRFSLNENDFWFGWDCLFVSVLFFICNINSFHRESSIGDIKIRTSPTYKYNETTATKQNKSNSQFMNLKLNVLRCARCLHKLLMLYFMFRVFVGPWKS